MPGWAHDKSGSNDASNLPTVRSYQRCSYFQVSGQFESEPRRATRLTADFTVSHDKNPKFGKNAQAHLPSVTNFQFSTCRTDAFTQGDQTAKLTVVLVSGAKMLLV